MAAITLDIGGNTRQLDRDIQNTVNKVYTINLKTKGDQPLGRITGQVNEFNKSLDASNARVIAFGASAGIIFGVERAFTALVSATIEVQKSLQDINVILNASQANLQKFGAELFSIARNTGQSFQEVAKAATEFSRQGLGIEETLKRTNEALILSRLSGLDAAKSVESLTAAVNSFASQAVTATEVVNKFATVDAAFAVSSADLADAIARVGSSAAQSGVSLNELIAIVTSAQQTTARGGAVIGNSFKTIFTRLQREKVVDLLESLGISGTDSSGQVKSTIQLLTDLGKVYDTLGSQQQAYVAEQVGGVFQINILKAALADLGKEYSIYSSALNVAAGATDQAIRRNEELNKTYAAQINALAENARQLAAAGGERLLGPSIDRLVGGTNTLLEGFSESDGQGVGAVLGKGILDGIGQFIAGPGLALIGGVLLKLFRDLAKFATGSVQQLLGLNTAATQQRDLQASIQQILSKNPQLLELALKGEQGLNQAANSLLASLQKQTVELQKQAQVAQQISKAFVAQAGVRVTGGVPVVPTPKAGGRVGKAAGYIPNFADDYAREELLATALGAKNPSAQLSKGTIDGKKFIKNNREIEITGFGKNGDSAVIPTYGRGFIPNFQKGSKLPQEIIVTGAKKYGYLIPSTAPGRLSTPDKPIGGGVVTDTANNIRYVFPPQIAYGPKLIGEAETSNKLENQIYQSVLNITASYTKKLAPPGKQVSTTDLEKGFSSAKGAKGAILSAIGAAFEVGITTALGYQAAKGNTGAGDFDVRAGTGIEKVQSLFGIGNILKADFKATTGKDSVESFRKKILREEYGFGGAKKRTGLTGKELRERGLTKGFKGKASGYIPNFAAIQDAINRERDAGIPKNQIYLAQEKALTSANSAGLGVFNKRDEPNKSARKDAMRRKGFAKGYIPNFAIEDPDVQAADLGSSVGAVVTQLGFLALALRGSGQEYKNSLQELTKTNVANAKINLQNIREQAKANINYSSTSAFKESRKQAANEIRSARAEVKTAERGTAGQKLSAGLGSAGLALGFGAPIIAETIKNAIGQETAGARKTGAAVGAAGQIASFAGTGAMFGPWGAAIGAATGALLTVPSLIDEMTATAPEFAAAAKKASQDLTKFNDAGQQVLTSSAELSKLLKEGASGDQLKKAQEAYNKALSGLSSVDRGRLATAAKLGKLEEEYAKILAEKVAKEKSTQSETELAGVRDQIASSKVKTGITAGAITSAILPGIGPAIAPYVGGAVAQNRDYLSLGTEEGRKRRTGIAETFTTELKGAKSPEEFLKSLRDIKIPKEVTNKQQLDNFIDGLKELPAGFRNTLKEIGAEDPAAVFQLLRAQIIYLRKDTADFIKDSAALQAAENERQAVLKQEQAAIDATISSIQKNIAIQNLWKSSLENLGENMRGFFNNLKIEQELTKPRETLEGVIGADKTPVRRLAAQEGLAGIQEQQRSSMAEAAIGFKESIRGILQEPFQENINKIIENLTKKRGALDGTPESIKTDTQEAKDKSKEQFGLLNQTMEQVEGYMAQFVSGQISTQQLLEQSRAALSGVGIDVNRGTQASNDIERAVAELEVKSIQEQVKAFQQRAKLASETKQAILKSRIEAALGTFGGFEGFMNRPNEEENYIQRITPDLEKIGEIRSSLPFTYNNKESVEARKQQAPELARSFTNVYKQLIDQSGGAFRRFIQQGLKNRQLTSGQGGRAGKFGGFDDIIAGRQVDLEQQLKLAEDQLKITTDETLKRDLQGFIDSVKNMPGGLEGIATLQTQKELGVARESDFQKLFKSYDSAAFEELSKISPELAASLASASEFTDDPLLNQASRQTAVQTEILKTIKGISSQQAPGTTGTVEPFDIEAYNKEKDPAKRAAMKAGYGGITPIDMGSTAGETVKNQIKAIQDKVLPTTPKPAVIQPQKTNAEIEAETRAKRDQKYLTSPLAPLNRTTGKKFENIEQVDAEMTKALALGAINPEQKEYYNVLKNFKQNLNPVGGTSGRQAMFMYDDMNQKVTQPRINQALQSNQQPAAAQQSFTQQEAAFNSNTSALTTLAGGIESLNSTLSNFEANFGNLNNVPGAQPAGAQAQAGAQPNVTTTTNAPVNVTVNAQGGGDLAAAVGEAVQNAIPTIIDKVRMAMGEKVPPAANTPTRQGGK